MTEDEGEPMAVDHGDAEPDKGPSKLAKKIAEARKERGVTQKQLAERMRVRQSMISMFETGEDQIGDDLASRLRQWVESGQGASSRAPRGPRGNYNTTARSTIKGRE